VASPVPDSPRVRFGPFEMDPSAGRLLKSGTHLKLQPQPFRVLLLLANRAGQVVTREEIQSHLWGDATFVDFERGINFSINQIRGALCDDAEKPRYVETLPRVGYRFIAPVEYAGPVTSGAHDSTGKIKLVESRTVSSGTNKNVLPILMWLVPIAVICAVVVLVALKFWRWGRTPPRSATVAVLPFQNAGSDKDIEFLRFAIPDEIATALSYAPSVSIRPSAMTAKYVGPDLDLQRVGSEMHVSDVVTGHYLKEGDRLRVVLESVDVKSSRLIWRDSLTAPSVNLMDMREEITRRVRLGLLPALGITTISTPQTHPHSERAYDAYLRSIPISRDPAANREAIALLENSVAADPNFAPAWEALGRRYNHAVEFANGGPQMMERSDQALERALKLDPNRVVADGELIVHRAERRELGKAYTDARKLVTSHPDSAQAHYVLGYVYRYAGMLDLSASECDTALTMDPANYNFRTCAWTFTELGKKERARDFLVLDAGTDWAAYGQLTILMGEGKLAEARNTLQTISSNPHHFRDFLEVCLRDQQSADLDHFAADAQSMLQTRIDPEVLYYQGAILVFCGRQAQGVRLLEGAISGNYCAKTALQTDPLLVKLRGAASYNDLLTEAGHCEQRLVAESQ
jgi:DNA-binding winged helix-turn-helix (wHTH) protein/TolB-like protein/tetratricopeptide (TPR) repeat protein